MFCKAETATFIKRAGQTVFLMLFLLFLQPASNLQAAFCQVASPRQASNTEPAASALSLENSYKKAWRLVAENTLYPERLKDWPSWEHRFDGKIKSSIELEKAISLMLANLKDKYTYFRNEGETLEWRKGDNESAIVKASLLKNNIAYLEITSFSSLNTSNELELALSRFKNPSGFVIDLRGNRGGYVEQALACFELMTSAGKFVSMKGREEGKPYCEILNLENTCLKRELNGQLFIESRRRNLCLNKPMIVLIDQNTRSAAEMLAGALRDTNRAKLVGSRTFGKGVVQSCWNLEAGCSLKIAMAHYFLPSGEDINEIGIKPDLLADLSSNSKSTGSELTEFQRLERITQPIINDLNASNPEKGRLAAL